MPADCRTHLASVPSAPNPLDMLFPLSTVLVPSALPKSSPGRPVGKNACCASVSTWKPHRLHRAVISVLGGRGGEQRQQECQGVLAVRLVVGLVRNLPEGIRWRVTGTDTEVHTVVGNYPCPVCMHPNMQHASVCSHHTHTHTPVCIQHTHTYMHTNTHTHVYTKHTQAPVCIQHIHMHTQYTHNCTYTLTCTYNIYTDLCAHTPTHVPVCLQHIHTYKHMYLGG